MKEKNKGFTDCEACDNFEYDYDSGCSVCTAPLDEDEMCRLMNSERLRCPFYQPKDDYRIVRKQN